MKGRPKVILIASYSNIVLMGVNTWSWYIPTITSNFFKKSNGVSDRIIFEDNYAIVLENTYTLYGTEKAQTYTTLIDKKRLTFVFVGLEYQNNTPISEGKCKLF